MFAGLLQTRVVSGDYEGLGLVMMSLAVTFPAANLIDVPILHILQHYLFAGESNALL